MVTLEMMQFTAVVLMLLLTAKLLLLRGRRAQNKISQKARWLMIIGTTLLAIHFALQLGTGLRHIGITQSVMLNLAMLIPASYFFSWAVLLLQRRGTLSIADWCVGPFTWITVLSLLFVASLNDDMPLISDSPQLRFAEKAGAVLYMLMQGYYTWRHLKSLITMRHALRSYYDRDTDGMLRWMQLSIVGLMLLALMVPVAIFGSGPWLLLIAFAVYFFIFYLVDCFCFYLTSPAPERLQAVERHADEMEREETPTLSPQRGRIPADGAVLSPEMMQEVSDAVEAWKARRGYRQAGILQPMAAKDIGVSRYRLTCWLHQQGLKYTDWISELRIDEAKHVLMEHPDWTTEAVAEYYGFNSREYFHRIFRQQTGMTPSKYINSSR